MEDLRDFMMLGRKGVWQYLLRIGGWAASERGSASIELIDLVKAIYIVDLEHVAEFWTDWEGFERFVLKIGNRRRPRTYLSRTLYLIEAHLGARETPETIIENLKISTALKDVVVAAKKVSEARGGEEEPITSRDFLYCACNQDSSLSLDLQEAGLQFEKLEAAVKRF
jgi:hypothetical protein